MIGTRHASSSAGEVPWPRGEPSVTLSTGDLIGDYRIEVALGSGRFGTVYRATHARLGMVLALRVASPSGSTAPEVRARLVRDSLAVAALAHPGFVPILQAGEDGESCLVAMALIEHQTLLHKVASGDGIATPEALAVVARVGEALDALHASGLQHGRLCARRVLMAGSRPYVGGVGLGQRGPWDVVPSRLDVLDGVAPEQLDGRRIDARTDVYSLGCLLVRTLTGGAPFPADAADEVLRAHLSAAPRQLEGRRPEFTREFDHVVARALAKEPSERYDTCAELVAAATATLVGTGTERAAAGPARDPAAKASAQPADAASPSSARVGEHAEPPASPGGHEAQHAEPPASPGGHEAPLRLKRIDAPKQARDGAASGAVPAGQSGQPRQAPPRRSIRNLGLGLGAAALAAVAIGTAVIRDEPVEEQPQPAAGRPAAKRSAAAAPVPAPALSAESPVRAGERPTGLALTGGGPWVADAGANALISVTAGGQVATPVPVADRPSALTAGAGGLWVASAGADSVTRVDPNQRSVVGEPIPVGAEPVALALGARSVWVANKGDATVSRIDRSAAAVTEPPIPVGSEPTAVATTEDHVWVANAGDNTVSRIDVSESRAAEPAIGVGDRPEALTVGAGTLWVANAADGSVSRISVRRGRPLGPAIRVGGEPVALAFGGGYVWVADAAGRRILRLRPQDGRLAGDPITVRATPSRIRFDSDAIWVLSSEDRSLSRIPLAP